MNARWIAVGLILVVLGLGVGGAIWLLGAGASTDAPLRAAAVEAEPDSPSEAPDHEVLPERVASTTDEDRDPAADDGTRLRGQVQDEQGRALSHAWVHVRWASSAGLRFPLSPPASEAESEQSSEAHPVDADGAFLLSGLPLRPDAELQVEAEGFGLLRRRFSLVPGRELDLGVLTLRPEARITGQVRTRAGRPIAGAAVRDREQVWTECDEDGRFVLSGLGPRELWLYAEAEGYAPRSAPPVRVRGGDSIEDFVLEMEVACFVEGSVLDPEGAPVVGAQVSGRQTSTEGDDELSPGFWAALMPRPQTQTDAQGQFRLGPFVAGKAQVDAFAAGHDRERETVDADARGLVLWLDRRATVFGRVVDAQGEVVEVHRVQLLMGRDAEGDWQSYSSTIDPRELGAGPGEFELAARRVRRFRVMAEGPDFARSYSEAFQIEEDAPYGPVIVRAEPGSRLAGSVRDDAGGPIPGAVVRITEQRGTGALPLRRDLRLGDLRADENGDFVSPPLAPASYELSVRHEGLFSRDPLQVVVDGRFDPEDVTLVLDRGGWIAGAVRPSLFGAQWAMRIEARAEATEGLEEGEGVTLGGLESDGSRFRVGPLRPGPWTLSLIQRPARDQPWMRPAGPPGRGGPTAPRPEGPPWAQVEGVSVVAGEESWVELSLERERLTRVEGRLIWDGEPRPFGRVQLIDGELRLSSTTDRSGRYEFEGAFSGRVVLAASDHTRSPIIGHQEWDLVAGGVTERDFSVQTGSLQGRVVGDADGAGLAGVDVTVQILSSMPGAPGRQTWVRTQTGESGEFAIEGVPEGRLRVDLRRDGYVAPEAPEWRMGGGDVLALGTVELIQGGSLRAQLTGVDRFELRAVHGETGRERSARGRRGNASLRTMVPGPWTVDFVVEGDVVRSEAVTITAGETERLAGE